jgi:dipeptidyl aminopeptidase/acylaminoacyl peptidase
MESKNNDPAQLIISGSEAKAEYDSSFRRVNTSEIKLRSLTEFDGLRARECFFPSNNGQRLFGCIYSKCNTKPQGVIIIAHGLGIGGQCVYMDSADYFASNGYLVFAYDATGMDRSEGDTAIGMEQGLIDLNYAIEYIEHDETLKDYPIALFGHSWGAYCVCAALNFHPEVKAVVSVSGFNSPLDYYRELFGAGSTFLTYFTGYEKKVFKKYTEYSAMSGFPGTNAGIMIIHSTDDLNVPISSGYDIYYRKYKYDDRFLFRRYENRGHLFIFYTDKARAYNHSFYICEQSLELSDYGKSNVFDKAVGYEIDQDFYKDILCFLQKYCSQQK